NTNGAVSSMRRCVDLAVTYARVREAFGQKLIALPLHTETLANLQVEVEGALAVGLRLAELLGKVECNVATDIERATWRLLTPLAKLGTGKQAVSVASETLEAFGGAGYIEDTDIPRLLRDAQVLPIWEGTTNVLSLDALRAIDRENALEGFMTDIARLVAGLDTGPLAATTVQIEQARSALGRYAVSMSAQGDPVAIQLGARRFALSLYRTYAAALLCRHAAWELEHTGSMRGCHIATRWTDAGLTQIATFNAKRAAENLELIG
ncbi:MAG: acyl-CoA dehydrogenase family protein, partial [Myxococcota bacterium]